MVHSCFTEHRCHGGARFGVAEKIQERASKTLLTRVERNINGEHLRVVARPVSDDVLIKSVRLQSLSLPITVTDLNLQRTDLTNSVVIV